jgi:hypothetical protein
VSLKSGELTLCRQFFVAARRQNMRILDVFKNLYPQAGSAELARNFFAGLKRGFAAMLCALQQSAAMAGETSPGKTAF